MASSGAGHTSLIKMLGEGDDKLCKRIVGWVSTYHDSGFYFRVIDERGKVDLLITKCLQRVAVGESPWETFSPGIVRKRTGEIQQALNKDNSGGFIRLIAKLKAEANLCRFLMQHEEAMTQRDALLLVWLVRAEPEDSHFNQWCAVFIGGLDKDSWTSDLTGSMSATHLVVDLRELDHEIEFHSGYADALIEHAKHVAAGEKIPAEELKSKWPVVLDAMGVVGTRKVFQDSLLGVAIESGSELSEHFFDLYGGELSNPSLLGANDRTVSRLMTPLLNIRHLAGLAWIREFFQEHPRFFDEHPEGHAVQDFSKRLEEKVTTPLDDEVQSTIGEIAGIIGVSPKPLATGEGDESIEASKSEAVLEGKQEDG